jgi:hypothetical protein
MTMVQPLAATAAAPPRARPRAGRLTRRGLEIALGAVWLLDGALQFQPYMFTHAFFNDMLSMANMGLPGPVSTAIFKVTTLLTWQPVFWNAVFATLQVAIGIGLIWGRTARLARLVSIPWALGVWVIGEGVGALFMPGTSGLNGAPGAALLYVVLAVLLWPRRQPTVAGDGTAGDGAAGDGAAGDDAAAREGLLGGRGGLWCWAVLWVGLAALELTAANHSAVVPAGEASGAAEGEPGWLAAVNHQAGQLLAGRGTVFAVVAGLAMLAIAAGVLDRRTRRPALAAGIIVAVLYGIVGQDLGGLLTGQATDPGTAPLLVLLALALWPRRTFTDTHSAIPEAG